MPKVLQCAICKQSFLGGTYTLLKHFKECNVTINKIDLNQETNKQKNIKTSA